MAGVLDLDVRLWKRPKKISEDLQRKIVIHSLVVDVLTCCCVVVFMCWLMCWCVHV